MAYVGVKPAAITSATQAEIAGDLTVDTNTLKVDAAGNRVMIGTTTEGSAGADELTVGSTSGSNGITIRGGTTGTSSIYMSDATSGAGEYAGYIAYSHNSDSMAIAAAGGQRIRIDADGLKFGSDTAAANALDDYEEGSWTPGIATGTVGTSYAYYTKVGNLVTLNVNLHTFSDRTSTNAIGISGLPFTTSSNNRAVGAVMHRYIDDSGEDVTSWVEANVSVIKFYLSSQSSNWAQLKHNDLMSASAQIYMTITYQAA